MKKKTTDFRFFGGRSFGMRRTGRRGVAEPPGGRSPPPRTKSVGPGEAGAACGPGTPDRQKPAGGRALINEEGEKSEG